MTASLTRQTGVARFASVMLGCALSFQAYSQSMWNIEAVETGSDYQSVSAAIDKSDNQIHLVYGNWLNIQEPYIKYARQNGTSWETETVTFGNPCGTSIAVDNNKTPHFSFYNGISGYYDLNYGTKINSEWNLQVVDYPTELNAQVGVYNSIKVDRNNHPGIAYYDGDDHSLRYARWDGSQWIIEAVTGPNGTDGYISLALDQNDNPHIAFYAWGLKYAHWTGSEWLIETVDASSYDAGYCASLALDSKGNPHISYMIWPEGIIKYATWRDNHWEIRTVETVTRSSTNGTIAIDSRDAPHLCFIHDGYEEDGVTMKAVRYAKLVGSVFQKQTLAAYADYPSCLVVDNKDRPHVFYQDFNSGLYHASLKEPVNLSKGIVPAVSSEYGAPYVKENLTDSNFTNAWGSSLTDKTPYAYVDLGQVRSLTKLVIMFHQSYLPNKLKVGFSNDGANWDMYDVLPGDVIMDVEAYNLNYQYVGFMATELKGAALGVHEFEVYGR